MFYRQMIRQYSTYRKVSNLIKGALQEVQFVRIHGPTADEVMGDADLSDKTCLITGANSGIGLEVTRCLNKRDCRVLMACRNPYEARIVAKNVCEKPNNLKMYEINLASLASVEKCSENIIKQEKNIDILILNAATFGLPWSLTEDGLETTFQVNFLSQYFLLLRLEELLSPNARVIFTSSESHRNINWPIEKRLSPTIEDLSLPQKEYTTIKSYNISKLCGLLAMHYLGYRWLYTGRSVFCAHPGSFIKTRLPRNWWVYEALYTSMLPFSKTVPQAASAVTYCATSPDLKDVTTFYIKNCTRCEESELARDTHLSFKVQDLVRDVLRDRIPNYDYSIVRPDADHVAEPSIEATLMSNYSG
ncbi:unnamed protein product [Leptidea sinapis]|uniref:WW domain-containing oxidoreductase n=1 Tax=Leptidea sinapis TaxID=189913 RepID=A0A5E4QUR8_9NEOP|nr:unnamed protein product [Leptidea sinapis]